MFTVSDISSHLWQRVTDAENPTKNVSALSSRGMGILGNSKN